jgi:hypothetical protein
MKSFILFSAPFVLAIAVLDEARHYPAAVIVIRISVVLWCFVTGATSLGVFIRRYWRWCFDRPRSTANSTLDSMPPVPRPGGIARAARAIAVARVRKEGL